MANQQTSQNNYDPRYFIWTIVFLVATGICLVTYIVSTDETGNASGGDVTRSLARKK